MMFGLREEFRYGECSSCGSLWLAEPPPDLGRFYGDVYYSMAPGAARPVRAARLRSTLLLALPRRLAPRLRGKRGVRNFIVWLSGLGISLSDPIADVGAGEGALLFDMAAHGFGDLWGFDPFIHADRDAGPVHLRRAGADAMGEGFAAVMLHHSLEHMAETVGALETIRTRLRPGGVVIVRVPIAQSAAHRRYGVDWVGLDAPRHLSIPTEEGVRRAAESAGLHIEETSYDSYALQFWGSELYTRDIPLRDPRSPAEDSHDIFSAREIAAWESEATALNAAGQGDAAAFVLRSSGGRGL
jgi:SAM-dependent methyltransferase